RFYCTRVNFICCFKSCTWRSVVDCNGKYSNFLVSETIDTEIYTLFKIPFIRRVMYSGVASGFLDSALFVIIGISPFGIGFIEWSDVPYAILGQWMIKVLMQLVVAGSIRQI